MTLGRKKATFQHLGAEKDGLVSGVKESTEKEEKTERKEDAGSWGNLLSRLLKCAQVDHLVMLITWSSAMIPFEQKGYGAEVKTPPYHLYICG